MTATIKHFDSIEATFDAVYELLHKAYEGSDYEGPYGIMISGGSTPLKIYDKLSKASLKASENMTLLFSDDRHLPAHSPDSNYGNCLPMIQNIGLSEDQVLHIDADLDLEEAAVKYGEEVETLLENASIPFAILGMGTDGHTASIFNADDAAIRDRSTFPVYNTGGFNRVSVSTPVLEACDKLIFLVTGEAKAEILKAWKENPLDWPSGLATQAHNNVEIWTDIPASKLS